MSARPWLLAGAAGIVAVGNRLASGEWTRWSIAALAAAIALGWLMSLRCEHARATLRMPAPGGAFDRDRARWCCDRCGHTWDAGLDLASTPPVTHDGPRAVDLDVFARTVVTLNDDRSRSFAAIRRTRE